MSQPHFDPTSAVPDDFDDLLDEDVMDIVVEWFLRNFEEANTHDALEILSKYAEPPKYHTAITILNEYFSDTIRQSEIVKISEHLDEYSFDWIPHTDRLNTKEYLRDDLDFSSDHNYNSYEGVPPLESPSESVPVSRREVEAARSAMLHAVSELENILTRVTPVSPQIGGNFPPEEIGVPPYSTDDDLVLKHSISVLKTYSAEQSVNEEKVIEATKEIATLGDRIRKYVAKLGDSFAVKFAESLGKSAGTAVGIAGAALVGTSLWRAFGAALHSVAQAAITWLQAVAASL